MAVSPQELIHNILSDIWSIFNRAGISDDLVIIEGIAALLLEIEEKDPAWPKLLSSPERKSRKPTISEKDAETVRSYLIRACDLVQTENKSFKAAKLFDHYILFRLSIDHASNASLTYPTPRHIVKFITEILGISDAHDFADFTCGSGGLLVRDSKVGETFGVDISPEWVRIATANKALAKFRGTHLFIGDAFQICNRGELASRSFDCIAMVPPFGITIHPQVARETMGVTSGLTSESLFIRLALKKLNEQGRAVIMVPDTLLTRPDSQQLRKELLEQHTPLAIISLGEGALYPFDPQRASVLLLEKQYQPNNHLWLFNVVNDGYPRRRNRDITQDPPPDHDLTIITKSALRPESSPRSVPTKNGLPSYFAVTGIKSDSESSTFIGFVIQVKGPIHQCSLWLIEEEQPELATRRFLLAHLSTAGTSALTQYMVIPLNQPNMQFEDIRCDEDYTTWLSNRSKSRSGSTIFSHSDETGILGLTVVILNDGRLLGCTRSADEITHDSYHLHPIDYLNFVGQRRSLSATELRLPIEVEPEVPSDADAMVLTKGPTSSSESIELVPEIDMVPMGPEVAEDTSPSVALDKLKQQHDLIWRYADYLQGQLEMRAYTDLPPRTKDLSSFELLCYLDEEQRAIWGTIQRMVDDQGHAYYFTVQQLQSMLQTDRTKLNNTLELLEQAGVIVRVHINRSDKGTTIICYRLLTEYDVVQSREGTHETAQN